MQKVKVADVSTKTGTNNIGPWTNTLITGDDGAKFGSFEDSATEIEVGDLIELEPIIKGKNVNFEKWNMLEKGAGSGTRTHKDFSDGQDIRGASIEAQNAYSGVIQLIIHDKIKLDGSLALTALGYAASKLSQWSQSSKPITQKPPEGDVEAIESEYQLKHRLLQFENVGTLLNWCAERSINRKKFMEILGITDTANINISDAYQVIKEHLEK